jgi:hypothetical protein
MVKATVRLIFVASLCVGLTGCAELVRGFATEFGAALLKEATSGHSSSRIPSQPPQFTQAEQPPPVKDQTPQLTHAEREHCSEFTGKGIEVTEPPEIVIPTDEGELQIFEAATWRLELDSERDPSRRLPVVGEGTLVITERSVFFVPPPNTAGVRIPYAVVLTAGLDPVITHAITITSCTGRFDVFVWQKQMSKHDPEAAAVAGALLKARVVAFQAATIKQAESPQ